MTAHFRFRIAAAARAVTLTIAATVALPACVQVTEPGSAGVPVIGGWQYSARQSAPGDADLAGTLSFTSQAGAQVAGALDFVETDARGLQRRAAGAFAGRTVDSTTLDFDVALGASSRRHVGKVSHDSLLGTWLELPAAGGAPTASGTFRAVRIR